MSAWDPWWVIGDYAETYHGSGDESEPIDLKLDREDDLIEEEDVWSVAALTELPQDGSSQ